ncbi:MAG: hypothetical protein ACLQVI_28690, partial [Polyangiaceae bacterium]
MPISVPSAQCAHVIAFPAFPARRVWGAPLASLRVFLVGLGTAGALGCEYTPHTTVMVRDPSAVRVEIDEGKGLETVLPPSAVEAKVPLPDTAPPFEEGLRQKTVLRRIAAGPIEIQCAKCEPEMKTLVPLDGRMTLGESFFVEKFDFTQREMRVHFVDRRIGPYSTGSTYDADVVTPWTNVAIVRRVSTPDRGLGTKLLLSAAIGAVLGGLGLGDGVADRETTPLVFGAVLLPLSAILAIAGGWYA